MPDPEFPFRYGPGLATDIELRWQERWAAAGTFHTPDPAAAAKAGRSSTSWTCSPTRAAPGCTSGIRWATSRTDVYARYLRMTGHHVLHPFGYDAFGLPAEQYAISTGQHPAVTTAANIAAMRAPAPAAGPGPR